MSRLLPIINTVLFTLLAGIASAQSDIEMADVMRSNGKIYVVVAVLVIIFVALVAYLISLDRKASKLEQEIKQHNS